MRFGKPSDERRDRCGLCGKAKDKVPKLIVGLHAAVCSDCIDLCNDILQNEVPAHRGLDLMGGCSELRVAVCEANRELTRLGLVTMHSGNVSGFDKEAGVVFI